MAHRIRAAVDADIVELTTLLVECVEDGASVGFMSPVDLGRAESFWTEAMREAEDRRRVLLVAEAPETGRIDGTVSVILAAPENQPHRGDLSKLLVHPRTRRSGVADRLMEAAERAASQAGKDLLVLDTASDVAERLYLRRGWQRVGSIPGYALWPKGGRCDTVLFFKELGPPSDLAAYEPS